MDISACLAWYLEVGVDEAVAQTPVNYFEMQGEQAPTPLPSPPQAPGPVGLAAPSLHHSPAAATDAARALADRAATRADLEGFVRAFDGCALKKTASKTVFSDGNPNAPVMIIGEAPGAQEDLQGIPFCGPSGKLLDAMLAAIGLDRSGVYIANTVFWRPPGNRQPTSEETAICLPLVEKHIALVGPALLVLAGGTATTTLLQQESSLSKLRGKTYQYQNRYLTRPIPTIITFHPSYLLRSPLQKALAWNDWRLVKSKLADIRALSSTQAAP